MSEQQPVYFTVEHQGKMIRITECIVCQVSNNGSKKDILMVGDCRDACSYYRNTNDGTFKIYGKMHNDSQIEIPIEQINAVLEHIPENEDPIGDMLENCFGGEEQE